MLTYLQVCKEEYHLALANKYGFPKINYQEDNI